MSYCLKAENVFLFVQLVIVPVFEILSSFDYYVLALGYLLFNVIDGYR